MHLQAMRALLARCWAHDPHDRPPFTEVITTLESILEKVGPRRARAAPAVGAPGGGACCSVQ